MQFDLSNKAPRSTRNNVETYRFWSTLTQYIPGSIFSQHLVWRGQLPDISLSSSPFVLEKDHTEKSYAKQKNSTKVVTNLDNESNRIE
jgi:hypothetical protein